MSFLGDFTFGFYLDPNGESADRMYTEHGENTGDDYHQNQGRVLIY